MFRHRKKYPIVLMLLPLVTGCLDPYQPPEITDTVRIMVIDGFINATDQSATVKLSYATSLSSTEEPSAALNASVHIEDDGGGDYILAGDGTGFYAAHNMSIDVARKYRLRVNTGPGSEYLSEYVTITTTPPIDSVTWAAGNNGITIAVNTHDAENHSKYYRWNYVEIWEYNSSFYSTYKMIDGAAFERTPDDQIFTCWGTEYSTEVLIGSTQRLSADVIRSLPLTFIKGNSVKLSRRFSILVEQQSLTPEAFDFWQQLKNTTESLGGLFDPLPAQLLSNIKGTTNAGEPVLGYFSGGQVSSDRIFIEFHELPREILALSPKSACDEEDVKSIPIADIPSTPNSTLLIYPIYVSGVGLVGYTTALSRCIDCQLQGGSTTKPDFW
jgi:hypothetical protein